MNNQSSPAICIQAHASLSEQDFSDLVIQLKEKGVSYVFDQREPATYASLEWLIPTGIVLIITRSYFDGIFKEIGKDHYQWFKVAVSSLYKKGLGDDPEVKFSVISAGKPKTPSVFSGTLSFFYTGEHGYRVKLLFPLDVTPEDYAVSCEEFMKLIVAHKENSPIDPIRKEVEFQARAKTARTGGAVSIERTIPTVSLLVFWNRHDGRMHVVDPVASSKTKNLVSREIGGA